jgi:hypothetical protein
MAGKQFQSSWQGSYAMKWMVGGPNTRRDVIGGLLGPKVRFNF